MHFLDNRFLGNKAKAGLYIMQKAAFYNALCPLILLEKSDL